MMPDFPDVRLQTLKSQTHMLHYLTSLMQNKLAESHEALSSSLTGEMLLSGAGCLYFLIFKKRKPAKNLICWRGFVCLLRSVTSLRPHISLRQNSRKASVSLSQLQSGPSVQKSSEIETEHPHFWEVCWEKTLPAYPSCPSSHEHRVIPAEEESNPKLARCLRPSDKQCTTWQVWKVRITQNSAASFVSSVDFSQISCFYGIYYIEGAAQ